MNCNMNFEVGSLPYTDYLTIDPTGIPKPSPRHVRLLTIDPQPAMTTSRNRKLRHNYHLHLEIGAVVALLILIAAFHMRWSSTQEFTVNLEQQEVVHMEEITQTQQKSKAPPPPKPPAPVEVPNNTVIEQQEVNFDASLDLDEELNVTEAPSTEEPAETETKDEEEDEIFVAVEQEPDCGGIEALQQEVEYPSFAKKAGIEGRVIVQFIIDEQGDVTNPTVIRGVHKLLDKEAIRAVKQLDCTPAKQRNRAVKYRMSMPVTFKLKKRS
jgi:protein TonB